jgi:SulP family sulfate permease
LLVLGVLMPWLGSNGLLAQEGLGVLATLTLLVGVIRVAGAHLGAATLIRFIPDSVLVGFTAGAGVMIAATQLDEALGLAPLRSRSLLSQIVGIARDWDEIQPAALAVALVTAGGIAAARRVSPRIPGALILIVAGAAGAHVLGLDTASGLPLVSNRASMPHAWPPLAMPDLRPAVVDALLVPATAIVLLGTLELAVTAGAGGARPDMRREILAQGWANIAGAFTAGIPASASLTRSALLRPGARTRLAAASGALLVLPFLLFWAELAGAIPEAGLAGVLLVTSWRMIPRESVRRLWRATPETRLLLGLTFVSTLVLRFEWAILFGTGVGLVIHLARTSAPRLRLLRPEADRLIPCADPHAEVVVLEVSGDLYYAAVPPFVREAERLIPTAARLVLIDLSHAHQLRYAALRALEQLADEVERRPGAELHLCGVGDETRGLIERTGSRLKWHAAEPEPGLSLRHCLDTLAARPDAE